MFFPGEKVICINDRFHRSIVEWADHVPQRGHVYTVKSCAVAPGALTNEIGPGLLLEELPNPGNQVCFSEWRFRLLEDSESDIQRLLNAMEADAAAARSPAPPEDPS